MRIFSAAILMFSLGLTLVGCGKKPHESTDDFLASLETEKKPGEIDVGTMPSVEDSFDDVAIVRVETTELDLGVIANDELTHAKLKIYNDGKMLLKVTKIDTTCACTQGQITPENAAILGGEESWIDIVVDPRRIPGFHSEKELTITTTDPKTVAVKVKVIAQVDPEYEIGPDEVDVGDIVKGEPFVKQIHFRQLIDDTVNVMKFEAPDPGRAGSGDAGITTSIEAVPETAWKTPGRQEFMLDLTFGPNMPVGPFRRHATLFTDIKRSNQHRIMITGTVIAPYAVAPAYPMRAVMSRKSGEKAYEGRITFSAATPFTIGAITPSDEAIESVVSPGSSPNEFFIDVRYEGVPAIGRPFDEILEVQVQSGGTMYLEPVGVSIPVGS